MPKRKETDRVTFIAEYRDGSVARFDIDPWTLRNGTASLHAKVKSKAVSSPVISSACTPKGDANAFLGSIP
jgi:hypothetical protein